MTLKDGWLRTGLSVQPADRATAESAVTELYRLLGKAKPAFEWFASPGDARSAAAGQAGFPPILRRGASAPALGRDWPTPARLASLVSDLRARLNAQVRREPGPLWVDQGLARARATIGEDALASGALLDDVLEAAVHDALRATLRDGICAPLRAALPPVPGDSPGLPWHGQHDAYWIGHYEVLQRIGRITCGQADAHQLGLWAALALAAGWWWPGEERCVMAERPTAVRTEPLPGAKHGELRLHCPDGLAIRFADGSGLHALHGTPVPGWVLTDPSIERIRREPNVEVRRCAIERIGWDTYIRQADLSLVAVSADPGNPGADLRLYDVPPEVWGAPARVLLVVNGSVERDGQRRRYGLSVPTGIDDPVTAAGWCYGLAADQYARLIRRT